MGTHRMEWYEVESKHSPFIPLKTFLNNSSFYLNIREVNQNICSRIVIDLQFVLFRNVKTKYS